MWVGIKTKMKNGVEFGRGSLLCFALRSSGVYVCVGAFGVDREIWRSKIPF